MEEIDISYNGIKEIPSLPKNLQGFYCKNNKITKIPSLPKKLQGFYCNYNLIIKLENLPNNLQEFDCGSNKISKIDNLSIKEYNNLFGEFDLKFYNLFKRLQRKFRFKYIQRIKAAIIIQKGCHNWLWKPLCKDSTIGIVPRLMLKKLK